jgi:HEAT repeat protein
MSQNSIEQIEINLRNEALNERKAALDELAGYPPEVAVPILQKLANERDFGLRRLAVMGLGNHKTEASFQTLVNILQQDNDSNVLAEAANSIFDFGDPALPELIKLFEKSDNWLVRQTVISLLVETEHHDALLSVATDALKDDTETVKEIGILALGQLLKSPFKNQALALLAQLTEDSQWRTRWRSAIALQQTQEPQAKELILKLQRDEHFRVVAAALEVAAAWGENL